MAAMAAIRHAGRRLVGGGRMAPAVKVAPSRPMSTNPAGVGRPNSTQNNLQSQDTSEKADLLAQVQQKKELLYDLICRHGYEVDGKVCMPNIRLLHHLSAQIKPRPNDFVWVYLRLTHTAYGLCMFLSPVVTVYGGWVLFKIIRDRMRAEED